MDVKLIELLTQYGPLGLISLWLALRIERKLERQTTAVDDLTRMIGLDLINRSEISEPCKLQITRVLNSVEDRIIERFGKSAKREET